VVDEGGGLDQGSGRLFLAFDFVRGDPLEQPYRKPFDVFLFSGQLNAAESKVIGRLTAYGRLYGKPLGRSERPRHALIVTQDYAGQLGFWVALPDALKG
jgi:hypothetical protein